MSRVMQGQAFLMDSIDVPYVHDTLILGKKKPTVKNPDHRMASMRKPFVSWDGEGYTDEWGQHHYWLLANSLGDKLIAPPGRSLERFNILKMFHRVQDEVPGVINTGFALGYDFTMMLRSNGLTVEQLSDIKKLGYMRSDGYVIRLMMGKMINTWLAGDQNNATGKFNLQDSWGFFQRSFIKALDEYFPQGWPERDIIVKMKAQRATFDRSQDEYVMKYNDVELDLMVMLMEDLREKLYRAGMPVSRWYGPGAIANGLFSKWRIKDTLVDLYEEEPNVAAISQYGYAGGRFELCKPGHANQKVYQYDINSAYPYAISSLPNLREGEWRHIDDPDLESLPSFSIVRLRWNSRVADMDRPIASDSLQEIYPRSIPFPFWRRTPKGTITYPSHGVHGWYWLPEAKAGIAYGESLPDSYGVTYQIEEAYAFYPSPCDNPYPFEGNYELYERRQVLKAAGDGAHIGIKLGLNSEYGKTCQQVGYDPVKGKKPPYHNLALAGYTTAVCRAMMIDAMKQNPTAIIGFETDGIFSLEPLDLSVGKGLGQWEETVWDDMWYFQSGFRFGIIDGEVIKPATRGIAVKDITLDAITEKIRNCLSSLTVKQTQFMTLQWAQSLGKPHLAGQWRDMNKVMQFMCENITGKRIHDPDCYMCDIDDDGVRWYRHDQPHVTIPASGYEGQINEMYKVVWRLKGISDDDDDWDGEIEP
jgi:hypothetical protein